MPIAIIGIGCRLPGDVTNTEKLWELLLEGRDAWSAVPAERYNEAAFYHPNPDNDGTTNHRGGHFIRQNIAAFDAAFFNILPVEAQGMDPQQRLLLETTYEAFENAGIPIENAQGSNTAVYTASFTRDYEGNIYKDPSDIPKYHVTGSGSAILSNRISYIFNLKGPSMTLDTGCSGSMVALHQACQSLRTGESTMALASGVNLILNPDIMFGMSNLQSVPISSPESLSPTDVARIVCLATPESLIPLISGVQGMVAEKVQLLFFSNVLMMPCRQEIIYGL